MNIKSFSEEQINYIIIEEIKNKCEHDDTRQYNNKYFTNLDACNFAETVILGQDIERWVTYDKLIAETNTTFTFHTPAHIRAQNLVRIIKKHYEN